MYSKLFAGAARVSITPPDDWYPLRRGLKPDDNLLPASLKDNLLVENLDSLYARALALEAGTEKAVVITIDYIVVPQGEKQVHRIAQALGLDDSQVFLIATHTHNVPMVSTRFGGNEMTEDFAAFLKEEPQAAQRQMDFERLLLDGMLEAARQAMACLRPARIGIGYSESYINVNRDQKYNGVYHMGYNGAGHSDKTAALIRIEDSEGKTIARVANYACHAISAYLNRCCENGGSGTTADIPGVVSQAFEENDPGSVCLWTPAAQGNQNPIFMNFVSFPDPVTGQVREDLLQPGNYQVTKVLGLRHYADLRQAEAAIHGYHDEAELCVHRETLPIPIDPNKTGGRWFRQGEGDCQPVVVSGLQLDDILLFGIGGELYSDVGERLKALSPVKHTLIVTLCVGCGGYMMNDDDLTAPTLFALRTRWKPGYLCPALEDALKRFTTPEERSGNTRED